MDDQFCLGEIIRVCPLRIFHKDIYLCIYDGFNFAILSNTAKRGRGKVNEAQSIPDRLPFETWRDYLKVYWKLPIFSIPNAWNTNNMTIRSFSRLISTRKGWAQIGRVALASAVHALVVGWVGTQIRHSFYAYEVIVAASLTVWLLTVSLFWHHGSRNDAVIAAVTGGYVVLLHVVMYSRLLP